MGLSLPIWVVINQNWAVIKDEVGSKENGCLHDLPFWLASQLINNYVLQLLLINKNY